MKKRYPKFKRGEINDFYESLPKVEKDLFNDYLQYRKARGVSTESKVQDIRRYLLQLRFILDKNFKNMDLKELRELLVLINQSQLSDFVKNGIKVDLKNFLKFVFKDYSYRFNNLEDVRTNGIGRNQKKINSENIYDEKDIKKMLQHENKNFWKAFLIVQFEGGLRTIETRLIKWGDLKFNIDEDITELTIFATKTKRSRTVFLKESTFYLKKLKEEQENMKIKSIYVFPSKKLNEPVNKNTVSMWFRQLTKKSLGREGWNYLLRHSRATQLYRLAKQGQISKDVATKFMGHGEDMSEVYTHLDQKEIKEMLKQQIYKLEDLPEEKKHELEIRIEQLEKTQKEMNELLEKYRQVIDDHYSEIFER